MLNFKESLIWVLFLRSCSQLQNWPVDKIISVSWNFWEALKEILFSKYFPLRCVEWENQNKLLLCAVLVTVPSCGEILNNTTVCLPGPLTALSLVACVCVVQFLICTILQCKRIIILNDIFLYFKLILQLHQENKKIFKMHRQKPGLSPDMYTVSNGSQLNTTLRGI